ncbi:MAG: PVC-type heme-binding CxxCH protein [Verrucomicrobiota bacterium]
MKVISMRSDRVSGGGVRTCSGVLRCAAGLVLLGFRLFGQHAVPPPDPSSFQLPEVPPGRAEAEHDLRRLSLPPGWKASVWAAEPDVVHPVSFDVTSDGRVFVAESLRAWRGVPDIRNLLPWLDEDVASRTVDDRLALMRRIWGDAGLSLYSVQSERVRLLTDSDGDGRADHSQVFASGFNTPLDGVASSVLARGRDVWFANIPDIWRLTDTNGDGIADLRRCLSHGHGVRISMLGHDLHGLTWGPDGRVYVSVGDRASHVLMKDAGLGIRCGAVFRFEPDGSGLEMVAEGLRNPQGLVFDDWGNLFTGDNNANIEDESRWVQVVAGGDSGWRIGWQWAENPKFTQGGGWRGGAEGPGATSPWITEGLWKPAHAGQPAYIVPPVANFSAGPCGNCLYPGTGLDASWNGQFLLTDFRGSSNDSLLWRFRVVPDGAGFRVVDRSEWIRGVNATDVAFGPDGAVWLLDWTDGWEPANRGRIHLLTPPPGPERATGAETASLLRAGMESLSIQRCLDLLAHADRRVRQEAQFALVARGSAAVQPLVEALGASRPVSVRRHAVWALGQLARGARRTGGLDPARALDPLIPLLSDSESGIRRVTATVLGELRYAGAAPTLIGACRDADASVCREAAMALGRIGDSAAVEALVALARRSAGMDPILRHAVVQGLLGCTDADGLLRLGRDPESSVRLVVVVALRRQQRPELSRFLVDPDPAVRAEAARAIHDLPISASLPDLAAISDARLGEPAFSRRVVNACLRVGTTATAEKLGSFATNRLLAVNLRADGIAALAAWPANEGRDRITGLWRPPNPRRDSADARAALETRVGLLLEDAADAVVVSSAVAAARLKVTSVGPILTRIALNDGKTGPVRTAALQALSDLEDPSLAKTVEALFTVSDPGVRGLALRLAARLGGPGAVPLLGAVLESGTDSDRQAAFSGLARIHDPAAAALLSDWMDRLISGKVADGLRLDLVEAAEASSDAGLKARVTRVRETLRADPLGIYRLAMTGGSAEAGQGLFQSPEVQCIRCHKIWGRGGEVGPDLSKIGSQLDRATLLESVVFPDHRLAPGYETVLVTMDDGELQTGIAISEDASRLVLRQFDGTKTEIPKARIRSRERGRSAMPGGLAEVLGSRRLRDLIEYLSSLRE